MTWRNLLLIPFIILLAYFVGESLTYAPFPMIALIACSIIGLVTFQNPENGLLIIVFSMMLSPEISLADVPGHALSVRIDDLLIIAVFIAWLARLATTKDWKGFNKTPLDFTLLLLLCLYIASTCCGILFGVIKPLKGFFYSLKYAEYFILYWTVANIVSSKESYTRFLTAGLITCLIVTLFAYSLFGKTDRVYAPFDTGGGEPASLGGYYLVMYALLFSFLLHLDSFKLRLLCFASIIFLMPPFVRTLSRASYLAFGPMLLTIFFFTRRRKASFGLLLLAGAILFPILFKGLYIQMSRRVLSTFSGGVYIEASEAYSGGNKQITDQSALDRMTSWQFLLREKLTRSAYTVFFGNGVTGAGFIEGQFFLVLGEIGIVGAALFYGLLVRILWSACRIYRSTEMVVPRSMALALISCLIALVFQSLTTNTFIVVRIMEPFWFLTALVMISPDIFSFPLVTGLRRNAAAMTVPEGARP